MSLSSSTIPMIDMFNLSRERHDLAIFDSTIFKYSHPMAR